MGAQVIDGKGFAAKLRERVGAQAEKFAQAAGRKAGLAVVLVGEDPASQVYVRSKHKATVAANMESFEHRLPADTGEAELLALVEKDREWNEGAAKAQLFTIFEALKPNDPVVLNGRRKLSSMIFA